MTAYLMLMELPLRMTLAKQHVYFLHTKMVVILTYIIFSFNQIYKK
jgi:hypothetical protein